MFRVAMIVVMVLGGAGASGEEGAAGEVSDAISRGLQYLEARTLAWKDSMGCASCHHTPMMLWASYEAKERGFVVNESSMATIRQYMLDENDAGKLWPPAEAGPERDGTQLGSVYALLALAAGPAGWEGSELARRTREHFVASQEADGSWPEFPSMGKPPIFEGGDASARMVTLALQELADRREDVELWEAVAKAEGALSAPPVEASHQAQALQLMVDVGAGAARAVIEERVAGLLALQREDGSWGQTAEMAGDAYATGQTLYALGRAGLSGEHAAVARAVAFLWKSQREDGSWAMLTRASRPYSEGGEPPAVADGREHEPIVVAATGWAVLGLLGVM